FHVTGVQTCALPIFEVNFRHQTQVYAGYPFFKDRKVGKKELKNRQNTYDASLTKFFRSLYHNTLQKDGYLVRRLVEVKNKEKERSEERREGEEWTGK